MIYILHIETSGAVCSVGLSANGEWLGERQNDSPNAHAKTLTLLIEDLMAALCLELPQLSAVAVSIGPGSYTGLRIGLSAAKGLCYALDIPLITVSTLASIARSALAHGEQLDTPVLATIDARRNEVYMGIYDSKAQEISPVAPRIVAEDLIQSLQQFTDLIICGNGAFKFKLWVGEHSRWQIIENTETHARYMAHCSYTKFSSGEFADLAYTEPLYLKEFVGANSKA